MNTSQQNVNVLKGSILLMIAIVLISLTSCSLTSDNATKFAYQIETAAKELKPKGIGSEFVINFEPIDIEAPFTILVLSENGVTYEELIEKGIDSLIVKDLFPQLSYIDLKDRATLVVYQNGSMSFTTYYRRFVDVKNTQVIKGAGNTDILLKSVGLAKGNLSNEVLLVELQ